jgi:hypothetical protein
VSSPNDPGERLASKVSESDTYHLPRAGTAVFPELQRCGPHACGCADEERAEDAMRAREAATGELHRAPQEATLYRQPYPGEGMERPGDCSWATYLQLRLAVESAKAVVSMMGKCRRGDSCTFLATKIAAITAEIAARVTMMTTCFRGGDTVHRGQVQEKINMVNTCQEMFNDSNCPQALVGAMAAVVAAARIAIETAAVGAAVVVVALAVAALVAAIIALIDVIAALLAAAAEVLAIEEALAAIAVLLRTLQQNLVPSAG